MNLSLLKITFLILLSLSATDLFAKKSKGVGLVLYNAITRPEEDRRTAVINTCFGKFKTQKNNDSLISDLYFSPLPIDLQVEDLEESEVREIPVWTKIENGHFCHPETVEDVLVRHRCLEDKYLDAFADAIELKNEIVRDVHSNKTQSNDWHEHDINSIRFDLYIKSDDPKLTDIDIKGWDFGWLLGGLNPFMSDDNSCPFHFTLRAYVTDATYQPIILEDFPL